MEMKQIVTLSPSWDLGKAGKMTPACIAAVVEGDKTVVSTMDMSKTETFSATADAVA